MSRSLPYAEGSVFLVPLDQGGYARGVVARHRPQGKVLFAYFFAPVLKCSDEWSPQTLAPDSALLRLMCGDLALMEGRWPVVGKVVAWRREDWPMPDFMRHELGTNRYWRVRYSDVDPATRVSETRDSPNDSLPADSLSGARAVEIKLSNAMRK